MFLFDKPWLTTGVIAQEQDKRSSEQSDYEQAWSGFRLLLCVLSMLFFILVSAYFARMDIADWKRLNEPGLLWFNTGLLILSSVAMFKAQGAIHQNNMALMKTTFISAGLLTFAFLIGQLVVWQYYNTMGYFLASNPANTFFYMVTAIHGAHLIAGLIVWSNTSLKLMRGISGQQLTLSVEICATYWHYLLLIWFILFGLLLLT